MIVLSPQARAMAPVTIAIPDSHCDQSHRGCRPECFLWSAMRRVPYDENERKSDRYFAASDRAFAGCRRASVQSFLQRRTECGTGVHRSTQFGHQCVADAFGILRNECQSRMIAVLKDIPQNHLLTLELE